MITANVPIFKNLNGLYYHNGSHQKIIAKAIFTKTNPT